MCGSDDPDYALLQSDLIDGTEHWTLTWESVLGPQHSKNPMEFTDFRPVDPPKDDPLNAVLSRLSNATLSDEFGQAKANLLREATDINRIWTRTAFFQMTTLPAETSLYNSRAIKGIDDLINFVDHFSHKLKQLHQSSPNFIRPSTATMVQSDPIMRSLNAVRTHLSRAEREVLRTGDSMALVDAGQSWKATVQEMKQELNLLSSNSNAA